MSGTIVTPGGGAVCASRGTSESPSPPATSPITACQSPERCAIRGLKPAARQPAMNTSSHDQPTGGATHCASRSSSRSIRARPASAWSIGQHRVEDVAEQLLAVEARIVATRRGAALHGEDHVHVAVDQQRHGRVGLGLRARAARPSARVVRSGRAAGASRPASAVGKPATRTSPRGVASCAARSPSIRSSWANSASAWLSSTYAAGVSRTLRPAGSSTPCADLALERGELLRDRARRQVQRVRGRGQRAVVGDGAQGAQAPQIDHEAHLTGDPQKVHSLLRVAAVTVARMPRRHVLLATLVAVIWGVNFVVIHVGLDSFPPLLFAALRFCLVALALPFVPRPGVPKRYVLAVGVFLSAGQFGLLFLGIDHGMPAGLASLVLQLQAAFTVGLAVLLLGERPRPAQLAGGALALAGIGIIAAGRASAVPLGALALTRRCGGLLGRRQRRHAQGAAPSARSACSSTAQPRPADPAAHAVAC